MGWEVSGGPMSWTRLSHLRGSGPTAGRSTKTLPAARLRRKGRKEKKKPDRTLGQMVKANLNRQNHTKKHTYTHPQKEKKEKIKIKNKINKKFLKIKITTKNFFKKRRATKPINKSTNDNKH